MKPRDSVMLYQNIETDTMVETIDLNYVDPISAINLEVECTNGATSNKGNWISDIVTKVEVVDGSDVLASLNQFGLESLHFIKSGKPPALFASEWAAGKQRHNATLFFGRYLWDRDYALNPTAYQNPQLKVTFNKAAIRAAGADGFAAGSNILLTAVAKLMEEQTAPKMYLMDKQIDSFTSAASGDKRVDLPRDFDYRLMLIRAYLQLSDIDEILSDVKLTCDTDKYVVMNRKTKQLDAEALGQFGLSTFKHDVYTKHQIAIRALHNKELIVSPNTFEVIDGKIIGLQYAWSNEMKFTLTDNAGTPVAVDTKTSCMVTGHALHATLPIVFGVLDQPDTWFNPKPYSKFEAVLTQAGAGGAVEVIAEQVRTQ